MTMTVKRWMWWYTWHRKMVQGKKAARKTWQPRTELRRHEFWVRL